VSSMVSQDVVEDSSEPEHVVAVNGVHESEVIRSIRSCVTCRRRARVFESRMRVGAVREALAQSDQELGDRDGVRRALV